MVAGQTHNKFSAAGLRTEANCASVLLDDALHDSKSDPSADPDGLRRVEGVKDLGLAVKWDSAAVIAHADAEIDMRVVRAGAFLFCPGTDANVSMLRDCVDRVVEQVGPDLIETRALAVQGRKVRGKKFSQ